MKRVIGVTVTSRALPVTSARAGKVETTIWIPQPLLAQLTRNADATIGVGIGDRTVMIAVSANRSAVPSAAVRRGPIKEACHELA